MKDRSNNRSQNTGKCNINATQTKTQNTGNCNVNIAQQKHKIQGNCNANITHKTQIQGNCNANITQPEIQGTFWALGLQDSQWPYKSKYGRPWPYVPFGKYVTSCWAAKITHMPIIPLKAKTTMLNATNTAQGLSGARQVNI